MNIKLIINQRERTFTSTEGVRTYLDALDDVMSPAPTSVPTVPAETAASAMVPSPSVGNLSLVPKSSGSAARTAPKKRQTPRSLMRDKAIQTWENLAAGGTVYSSRFKRSLVAATGCSNTAAQSWITKLNTEYGAGIILDRKRTGLA